MDYDGCIFYSICYCRLYGRFILFDTNILWLYDFFASCSTCSKSTKSKKPNRNISTEWAKVFSFAFLVLFIQKLGFIFNNLSGNIFQTSGVIALITLLYKKFREFPYTPVCRYTFHALAVLLHLTFKAPPTGAN